MPIYFSKQWWSGDDRDANPGEPLDPQPDWPKPQYRPGWKIRYRAMSTWDRNKPHIPPKNHVGVIRYVFREGADRLDFYWVIRTKTGEGEIAMATNIEKRIKEE